MIRGFVRGATIAMVSVWVFAASLGLLVMASAASAATVNTWLTGGTGPRGVTVDAAGNIFVSNQAGPPEIVSKLSPSGVLAGSPWPAATGAGPLGITMDTAGNLYTANSADSTISKITADGLVTTFPATGGEPTGIVFDLAGNLYTANRIGNSVTKVTPEGVASTLASTGAGTGPVAITADNEGNLYTANADTDTVSKITPSGSVSVLATTGGNPQGITIDSSGNLYTSDFDTNTITKITPGGSASPLATTGTGPIGITIDSAGFLYTANFSGSVTRVSPSGTSSTLTGSVTTPWGIAIDGDGNLYTADSFNDTVSKITTSGSESSPAPPERPATPSAVAGEQSATVTVPANVPSKRFGTPSSYVVAALQDSSKGCTVTPPATSCTVTGLSPGTGYSFTARAALNSWQTAASAASNSVTPTAAPTPDPTPTPAPSVSVTSVKQKVTRSTASITSRVTVSGAGKVSQRATTGKGKKMKTWCRASKTATQAGTYTLKCNLGKKGRSALRKQALKLTFRTTFASTAGEAVTNNRKLTVKRKR